MSKNYCDNRAIIKVNLEEKRSDDGLELLFNVKFEIIRDCKCSECLKAFDDLCGRRYPGDQDVGVMYINDYPDQCGFLKNGQYLVADRWGEGVFKEEPLEVDEFITERR